MQLGDFIAFADFSGTQIISGAIIAACAVGAGIALCLIWQSSGPVPHEKRARVWKAEWALLVLGIFTGVGLAFLIEPTIRGYSLNLGAGLALVGLGSLAAVLSGFKKWHIKSRWTRKSWVGMTREFCSYVVVAVLVALFAVSTWQALTTE